jgi:hypothetical protein
MNKPTLLRAELPDGFAIDEVEWQHLSGSPKFDYPIDYAVAVVSAEPAAGRLDLLVKWAPNAYCHFHRHLGHTSSVVLEGEQHIVETRPNETVHKVRKPGFHGQSPDGDVHMEYAGPEGCVMLFSMQADDGRLFEVLDKDLNVLGTATIEDFLEKRLR